MGRSTAACAALLALTISLSACCCPTPSAPPPAKRAPLVVSVQKTAPAAAPAAHAAPRHVAAAPAKHKRAVRHEEHCRSAIDCTGCYASESDRDMSRTRDDLPCGGPCAHCEHVVRPGDHHECHN